MMRNSTRFILIIALLVSGFPVRAQEVPLFTHSYNNFSLYNPAHLGVYGYPMFYLTHRRQWDGIDGAPLTTAVSFNAPLKKSNIAYGGQLFDDRRGILSTNGLLGSFSYKIPFSEIHDLTLGLSVGAVMNSVNLNRVSNSDDMILANKIKNNISPEAQFGVRYQFKDLNVSLALPKIFQTRIINDQEGGVGISKFETVLASAGYKFHSEFDDYIFEPLVIYRYSSIAPAQLEVNGTFTYKHLAWAGASFRQNYGLSFLAGVRIQKVSIAYAFDLPTGASLTGYGNNTHEFQIGYHLGERKHKKRPTIAQHHKVPPRDPAVKGNPQTSNNKPKPAEQPKPKPTGQEKPQPADQGKPQNQNNTQQTTTAAEREHQPRFQNTQTQNQNTQTQTPVDKPVDKPVDTRPANIDPVASKPRRQEIIPPHEKVIRASKGDHEYELDHGSYVIVGAFANHQNAIKYRKNIQDHGYEAFEGFNTEKKLFYVYLFKFDDIHDAIHRKNEIRHIEGFENAWIFKVE